MWLLSTDRAELYHFVSPDAVGEGYAILSHVWNSHEQSFKDIRKLQKRCSLTGENPRNLASDKVKRCCEVAEQYGFKWVWIDSCCIDKTSSAELSEAINSMYRYYSLSQVCFVYMADVTISRLPSSFYESRWHTRGWTLQELIAPQTTYFLYSDWTLLGTRYNVARAIEEITRIPSSLLLGYKRLADYSVAQRMSWAANRKTTRVEDEAYCLFGLLDVNMPTLYGEGRRAFERLQEEILKQSPDTTVFAWGEPVPTDLLLDGVRRADRKAPNESAGWHGLFAPSSSAFARSGNITYGRRPPRLGSDARNMLDDQHILHVHSEGEHVRSFSITPHGVLAHIPVVEVSGLLLVDMFWFDHDRNPLALVLCLLPHRPNRTAPLYAVGVTDLPPRPIAQSLIPTFLSMKWDWRDVYIMKCSATARLPILEDHGSYIPFSHVLNSPFRFPEAAIDSFGALYDSKVAVHTPGRVRVSMNVSIPWQWSDGKPATFTFFKAGSETCYTIQLGVCKACQASWHLSHLEAPRRSETSCLERCWANVQLLEKCPSAWSLADHACPEDHIVTWDGLSKTFRTNTMGRVSDTSAVFTAGGITLSFALCPINPDGSFVLKEPPQRLRVLSSIPDAFLEPELN